MTLLLLLACAAPSAPAPEPPAPAPTSASTPTPASRPPLELTELEVRTLRGVCEPSAAIAVPGGFVLAEDDRGKSLVRFEGDAEQGAVFKRKDKAGAVKLDDVEAAAGDAARSWWLTSHSTDKGARTRLALAEDSGASVRGCLSLSALRQPGALAGQLARSPETCAGCAVPQAFEAKGAKEGGLDMEGLALLGDALYLGLRGPVTTDGRALVLRLDAAAAEAALLPCGEEGPADLSGLITGVWGLDLGESRGVRAMVELPGGEGMLLVAGPLGAQWVSPSLYSWAPGGAPRERMALPTGSGGGAPEALFIELSEDPPALGVLYDEGARVIQQYADVTAVDEDGAPTGCDCEALVEGRCRRGGAPIPPTEATATLRRYSWTGL